MGLSMILVACIYVVALFVVSFHVLHVVLVKHKRRDDASLASSSSPLRPPPPGPMGLPLIGNAFYFFWVLRHDPHRALARLTETYGPIASFRPGMTRRFVVVSSAAAACQALAGNDLAVAARWVPDSVRALAHHEGSVFFLPSSSPLWKQHRVTISAHISSGRSLEMTRHIRDRHARRLAEAVRAAACRRRCEDDAAGQPIAVGEAVFGAMVNAVANILFSRDLVDLQLQASTHEEREGSGQKQAQQQLYKGIMTAIAQGWARPNISDAFPFLAPLDLFGMRRSVSRNMAELYKTFDDKVIETRLASADDGGGANHGDDLLGVVLAHHAKSQITRAEICKLFTDIFLAGTDTSTITVEWAMARLLRHPDKLAKVRAELAANVGDSKEFVEESDVVGKLPYLDAVVKETMRLHPSLPVLPREVLAEEGVSLGGFGMPKGTYILVNVWALGRDPTAWPEPEEFVPERFLLGDNDGSSSKPVSFRGSDFTYIPFGAGRRVCPGMEMAARFVPLLLASLLHKVEWKLPDGPTAWRPRTWTSGSTVPRCWSPLLPSVPSQ